MAWTGEKSQLSNIAKYCQYFSHPCYLLVQGLGPLFCVRKESCLALFFVVWSKLWTKTQCLFLRSGNSARRVWYATTVHGKASEQAVSLNSWETLLTRYKPRRPSHRARQEIGNTMAASGTGENVWKSMEVEICFITLTRSIWPGMSDQFLPISWYTPYTHVSSAILIQSHPIKITLLRGIIYCL